MTGAERPAFVIWFTGLPASGKTTLAHLLRRQLAAQGVHTVVLDSDELRTALTPRPDYSDAERDWFYSVIAYLAAWLANSGVNVLVAATAHRRRYREEARRQIGRFAEVYVQCPVAVCRERDSKGLYRRFEAGQVENVPGLDVPYEPPRAPEAAVDTGQQNPDDAAEAVLRQLKARNFF